MRSRCDMKQDVQRKALLVIQQRKRDALNDFEDKMKPLYENQEFIQLEKEWSRLMIENAKKEVNGEKTDKEKEEKLKNKLEALKKNIKPNFTCPICQDEGYLNGQMCKCLKKEISNVLMKDSGFEKLESFDNSAKTSGDLAPVYSLMKKWCHSDFKKNLIYIAGPTGVGKTYLIRSMANELIERGKVVKIATAYQMNQNFKDFSKTYNEAILNSYIDTEILFIDDLGTEPQYRNVTLEYFYLIINERKMRKLPTIITSNLDMGDLRDRYDERIYSRIADRESSITIYLEGEDRRIARKQ